MKSELMSEPDRQRRKIQYSVAPRQGPEGSCTFYRTRVAGDPAVAFHIPLQATSRKPPVDGQRRIGINCGQSWGRMWGQEGRLEQELAVAARSLAWATTSSSWRCVLKIWSPVEEWRTKLASPSHPWARFSLPLQGLWRRRGVWIC
jgi:hypothetical protein